MRDFTHHRGRRQALLRLYVKGAWVLLLFAGTVGLARAAWGMYGKFVEATNGEEAATVQLTSLEQQAQGVSTTLQELSTPRGQEAQIRERFGVAKPGEGVIEIMAPSTTSAPEATTSESLWARVFHALFVW